MSGIRRVNENELASEYEMIKNDLFCYFSIWILFLHWGILSLSCIAIFILFYYQFVFSSFFHYNKWGLPDHLLWIILMPLTFLKHCETSKSKYCPWAIYFSMVWFIFWCNKWADSFVGYILWGCIVESGELL